MSYIQSSKDLTHSISLQDWEQIGTVQFCSSGKKYWPLNLDRLKNLTHNLFFIRPKMCPNHPNHPWTCLWLKGCVTSRACGRRAMLLVLPQVPQAPRLSPRYRFLVRFTKRFWMMLRTVLFLFNQETAGLNTGVSSRINSWKTKTPEQKPAEPKPTPEPEKPSQKNPEPVKVVSSDLVIDACWLLISVCLTL